MTTDEVDNCRRRAFAYGATRGQLGFDQQRLHDMVSGCAHRQELLRTDLKAGENADIARNYAKGASRPLDLIDSEPRWAVFMSRTCPFPRP
jgi:hypothetical protein